MNRAITAQTTRTMLHIGKNLLLWKYLHTRYWSNKNAKCRQKVNVRYSSSSQVPRYYHAQVGLYVIFSNLKSFHQKAPLTTALKLSVNLCEQEGVKVHICNITFDILREAISFRTISDDTESSLEVSDPASKNAFGHSNLMFFIFSSPVS